MPYPSGQVNLSHAQDQGHPGRRRRRGRTPSSPPSVEAALAEYEQALFPRGAEAAAEGTELDELMFGDDAPHGLIAMFAGQEPGH